MACLLQATTGCFLQQSQVDANGSMTKETDKGKVEEMSTIQILEVS